MNMNDLEQRFRVFIEKLTERAESLAKETRDAMQEIYDEDTDPYKRSFGNFLMGVKGQFNGIIDKAEDVFKQQIKPYEPSFYETQTPEGELQEKWFRKIHDDFEKWKDKMRDLADSIESHVKEPSAEEKLREIVEEYNAVKDNFHCSQCGAGLEIKELYFISTYITCPYCQTQNTFVPSDKMREYEFVAKDFAEEKTQEEEEFYERVSSSNAVVSEEKFLAYFLWRAAVWKVLADTVPVLAEANKKVFYREMSDILVYTEFNLDEKPDLYRKIIAKLAQVDGAYLQLAVGMLENFGAKGIPSDEFEKYLSEMKNKCK